MKEDQIILEAYEELKKREEQITKPSVLKKVPSNVRIILFVLGGIILYGIYSGALKTNNGLIILGIIGAIVYFGATSSDTGEMRLLTEQECVIKLSQLLRYKQIHPLGDFYQIPPRMRVKVLSNGKLNFLENKPWRWVFAISMFDPDTSLISYYAAYCNPYTGDLIGMKHLPGGLSDIDTKDIQLIPDSKMYAEKKYRDYLGKYWPKHEEE